jgi:hypothetical protein
VGGGAGYRADLVYQKNYLLLLLESVTGDRGWVAALAGACAWGQDAWRARSTE